MVDSKSLFWRTSLIGVLALTGCGGSNPPVAKNPTNISCELPLKYADGLNGGYAIGSQATQAVPRQFNTCGITLIQSASLSLCIDHPQIREVSARLVLPNAATEPLDLQAAQTSSASCLITGKLFTLSLPTSALQGFSGLQGNWTVSITDTDQLATTRQGYLVGWSMAVEGLQ